MNAATLSLAGVALGWGAAGITSLLTKASDTAIGSVIGTGPAALAARRMGALTPEGGIVTALALLVVALLYKASGKLDRRRILGGILTGAVLGFLPGVAAAMDWLPDVVNQAGAWGKDLANGDTA